MRRALAAALAAASIACHGSESPPPCGAAGEACCASNACNGALVCLSSTCAEDPCRLGAPGVTWVAFTSNRAGNYDVYRVHDDGTCLRPVTDDPGADLSPAWTAAGNIGFASDRTSGIGIYVHDLAAATETGIPLLSDVIPTAPTFSPDGNWVVFEGKVPASNRSDVYQALVGGGVPSPLTTTPGSNAGPAYTGDGATLFFASNRATTWSVYRMSAADGSSQTIVPSTQGILGRPAISPDGTVLAYTKVVSGHSVVVRHLLSDDSETVLTPDGDDDSEPAFDATGARLAVSSTRGGQSAVWIVDAADGGHPLQITTPPGSAVDGQAAFPW